MNPKRSIVVLLLLLSTIAVSFGVPKSKYKSPDVLSTLDIPYRFTGWHGKDASGMLNLNDLRYNFISKVFVRSYTNTYRENLLLLILDAGNFHNPKICFGSAGNILTELPDLELKTPTHTFKAHVLFGEKDRKGTLLVYWICINKKIVDWTEQKMLQLWYSMFNKEKTGLMVRLDIPARKDTLDSSLKLAKEFILQISSTIPEAQAEYIFGK
jgi:hypothetical protein